MSERDKLTLERYFEQGFWADIRVKHYALTAIRLKLVICWYLKDLPLWVQTHSSNQSSEGFNSAAELFYLLANNLYCDKNHNEPREYSLYSENIQSIESINFKF